ncbi:polar growth protein [Geranomyces variabilis]|uniref:Polar growth protein n=1 Tax=Geranomyces variabilis TaxID=109894 RepID=A0AAD5XRK2_9FUNG|nr:polar growth protein [Geranomyces variabilis]
MLVTDPHVQPDFYALDLPFVVYGRHRFLAEEEDEITFAAAEPVVVLERDELYSDGWWRGRNRQGHVGLFPKNFIAFDPPTLPQRLIPGPQQQQHQIPQSQSPLQQQQQSSVQDVDRLSGGSASSPTQQVGGSPPNVSKDLAKLEDRYTLTRAIANVNATPSTQGRVNTHPKTWDARAVETWLVKEGFEFALPYFKSKPVTGMRLLEFNLSSLRELGMESLSDRINILHQILGLKEEFPGEPQEEDENESAHGPSPQGTIRGSVVHVVSSKPGSPGTFSKSASSSSVDDKDDKNSQAARSQDSGFAEPADDDDVPRTLEYPTRSDSWNHAPLPAPGSPSSTPKEQRSLRKPASEFTLSDYFYDGAGGYNDKEDGDDNLLDTTTVVEEEELSLPAIEHLQLSSNAPGHGVPHNVRRDGDHRGSGEDRHAVGGMAGAPRDYQPNPSLTDLRDQDQNSSPRRQRSLNILSLTRSLTHRNFRKSAPEPAPAIPALNYDYPPVPQLPSPDHSGMFQRSPSTSRSSSGVYRTFPSPDFTGELEFRENEKGGWKKRWCVIDGGMLWVLKSREQPRETHRVPLTASTQFLPSTATQSHPYTFCVRTARVRLQFAAEAQIQMVSWLNALVRAGSHTERTRPVPLIPIRPDASANGGNSGGARVPMTGHAYVGNNAGERLSFQSVGSGRREVRPVSGKSAYAPSAPAGGHPRHEMASPAAADRGEGERDRAGDRDSWASEGPFW